MEPHERDQAIQAALRRRLANERSGDVCPDAEVIGAFMDGTLSGGERDLWRAHFSGCDRCRQHLAALVRATPAPSPTGVVEAAARKSMPLGWLFDWRMLATAAAVAVLVLAVWTLDPRPLNAPRVVDSAASAPVASRAEVADAAPADGTADRDVADQATAEVAAESFEETGAGARDGLAERENAAPLAAATAATPPDAVPAAPVPGAERPQAARRLALAPPETALTPAAPMVTVSTPDPLVRWRVTPAGVIERTDDGGGSWSFQHDTGGAVLGAGVAPSRLTCWLVGRGGAVFVTTDGSSWSRVRQPTDDDLVTIDATDGQAATVTAVSGQQFSTTDRGLSWNQP